MLAARIGIGTVVVALLSSGAANADEDFVTGTGTVSPPGFGVVGFELDVHSDPFGGSPRGQVALSPPDGSRTVGAVVCLRVSGSSAVFAANFPNMGALFEVVDASGDTLAAGSRPEPLGPEACSTSSGATALPVTSGDIAVHDARLTRDQARQACVFERVAHGRPAFRAKYGTPRFHLLAMRRCIRRAIGDP